ncbi:TetR/AcrR family transcriptional regulator [Bailinhaonella thermotolerans]|uniref:TetR/AcrR family transcriptional regulator n=1 Tax=Bailinhaonella thermotolerans TaxID=1070861 RepID=UPI001F5B31F8|nr:TetR/AcrR family transcriptional regulator [Bailinhaonella thermotolerans]
MATTTAPGVARPRRTQEERRAATQARLLSATAECLAELGWAGTSTTEVARRAGLSRGAQQHHFPTKAELVGAAVEHMLDRHRVEFEEAFARLPPERRGAEGALDLLWDIFRTPNAAALLELSVAARTDGELKALCADIHDRVADITIQTFERLFPRTLPPEVAGVLLRGVLALMAGLALQHGADGDRHGHQAAVLAQIKAIGAQLIPNPPAGRPPAGDHMALPD